jgi:hypothetical protein
MDGQERTSTRKKIDRRHWGVEHGGHHCCVSCARWCRAGRCSGGLSSTGLAPTTPGQCGKLILPTLRWQWSVRAAATILPQAWATVWGSPVFLRRWGKHQWKRWTPAILPRRLARHGRQHKGVAAAKTVARVQAQSGWAKPLGMAPYIGKLVPTTRKRCGLRSYEIYILIRSGFG